ncbi:hypothetical protein [Sphingomonas rubra]|uniref:Tetratricopeptide repeat-containing protein n=1 Tax=Sphingomonas rubra TaxID=634430 RepID=A0A1I5PZ02_9SPHN|nr:hypothetical protein [Sphingomonas rubra]SFP39242.1 hypothetical protein SAMN04488241_101338 [Sphingomonas rubra]
MRPTFLSLAVVAALAPVAAQAQSARDLLVQAAFEDRSKPVAAARIERVIALTAAASARNPDDQEAVVVGATALGYRAKLSGNRSQAVAARHAFEAAAGRFPRNAEAQVALGAWHMGIISKVGRLVGRVIGAQKNVGLAALDRSVALGGNRAMFAGLSALLRLQADADDARGRALAEQAARAPTPTAIDRYMQRACTAVLAPLRNGDDRTASALADRLLPLGWVRD